MALTFSENPMRRDTVQVKPNGFLILRFRADNPGIWLVWSRMLHFQADEISSIVTSVLTIHCSYND